MHLFGWLVGYLGPITLQLLQQQPRPGPPVLYILNDTLPTLEEDEEANVMRSLKKNQDFETQVLALQTAALNVSSSPYWSTSKARKSILVG